LVYRSLMHVLQELTSLGNFSFCHRYSNTTELQAIAALTIELIYVVTCDEEPNLSFRLMEKEEKDLEHPFTRIFALGLGLLYLGKQD
jgi:hypothetical protein